LYYPATSKPWFIHQPQPVSQQKAIVIGGGLAGCTTAYALSLRGWQVTLVERHQTVAQQASGNPVGVLYSPLSPHPSPLNDFYLNAYRYSQRYLKQHFSGQPFWQHCGVLQVATQVQQQQRHRAINQVFPDLAQLLNGQQASQVSGIELNQPGLFYPQGGWLQPQLLCQQLVANNRQINLLSAHQALYLQATRQQKWRLFGNHQQQLKLIASAPLVVIANSQDATQLTQTQHLPLQAIGGQVTLLPATPVSKKLNSVICFNHYITPAINQQHCIGATFNLKQTDCQLSPLDQQKNIAALARNMPTLAQALAIDPPIAIPLTGKAAVRCSTPDYLPIIGPVPDYGYFCQAYQGLGKGQLKRLYPAGRYYPGLYVNVGHGSKGIISTPLAAELITAMACQTTLPMTTELAQAVSPARFIIRDLIRNKLKTNPSS
jgi:tRNA 5-methylaminomethyl-2-thiouridine biosynthesis bifunctional protein